MFWAQKKTGREIRFLARIYVQPKMQSVGGYSCTAIVGNSVHFSPTKAACHYENDANRRCNVAPSLLGTDKNRGHNGALSGSVTRRRNPHCMRPTRPTVNTLGTENQRGKNSGGRI